MRKIAIACAFLCLGMGAIAQNSSDNGSQKSFAKPTGGDFSIGIRFNPIAASKASDMVQTAAGDFVGNSIRDLEDKGTHPHQMFFLTQDPMVSIQGKYMLSSKMSLRASVGFGGGVFNYREYVQDDAAKAVNEYSEAVVTDKIRATYTNGGVNLGVEFNTTGRLRFVGGGSLVYAWGGGEIEYEYGNKMTIENQNPTVMDKVTMDEFDGTASIKSARPLDAYNIGVSHGFGLSLDMGVEWLFVEHVSLGARVSLIPVMFAVQPQTYSVYEGYDSVLNKVVEYNQLVSEGSSYLLYGTQNISLSFSLNYYF